MSIMPARPFAGPSTGKRAENRRPVVTGLSRSSGRLRSVVFCLATFAIAPVPAQTVSSRLEAEVLRGTSADAAANGRERDEGSSWSEGRTGLAVPRGLAPAPQPDDLLAGGHSLRQSAQADPFLTGVRPVTLRGMVEDVALWLGGVGTLLETTYLEEVHSALGVPVIESSPLWVDVGVHHLQQDRAGQWVTLQVRNESDAEVLLSGLNLNFQIADSGPSSEGGFGVIDGPNISQVDLVTGTLFAGNHTGTSPTAGNVPQAGLWTVTTAGGTVSLAPGAVATLARIELNTEGFFGNRSWDVSLVAGPSGGFRSASSFVQLGPGGLVQTMDIRFNPGRVVIPEPGTVVAAVAVGLLGWAATRPRASRGSR